MIADIATKGFSQSQYEGKFDNRRELKGHILSVHEGKKVYRCPICKACFAEAIKLKQVKNSQAERLLNRTL